MRIAAIVFYVLAGLSTLSAISTVMKGPPPNAPQGYFAGVIVGAFMVPLILLVIGLVLWKKSEPQPTTRRRKKETAGRVGTVKARLRAARLRGSRRITVSRPEGIAVLRCGSRSHNSGRRAGFGGELTENLDGCRCARFRRCRCL
jgi:hypothetical protein